MSTYSVLLYDTTTKEVVYGPAPNPIVNGTTASQYLYWNAGWTVGGDQIRIGAGAGFTLQNTFAVALGAQAGYYGQQSQSVAVGYLAGYTAQQSLAVAIGAEAGEFNQGSNSVAIGNHAGENNQSGNSVAIGINAGRTNQAGATVAIGQDAAGSGQGLAAIAVGPGAGQTSQGTFAVAMGYIAGIFNQGTSAVALGQQAGRTNQGQNAIAIGAGAGENNQPARTIVLNASGSALNVTNTDAFYVNPVRNGVDALSGSSSIGGFNSSYNNLTKECIRMWTNRTYTVSRTIGTPTDNGQTYMVLVMNENTRNFLARIFIDIPYPRANNSNGSSAYFIVNYRNTDTSGSISSGSTVVHTNATTAEISAITITSITKAVYISGAGRAQITFDYNLVNFGGAVTHNMWLEVCTWGTSGGDAYPYRLTDFNGWATFNDIGYTATPF